MLKKLQFFILLSLLLSTSLLAQTVVLSDEFDNGDGKWTSGWIDSPTANVSFSIDNSGKLSGDNSYKAEIVSGSADTYRIQRNADLPLSAGKQYVVSFMAVADQDNASINVLFEINGDPYTKYLNETPVITTTPQTFTYTVEITEDVPTNGLKFHYGGDGNDNTTIWIDAVTVTESSDPTLVSQWGLSAEYNTLWPILNDANTPAGDAKIGGEVLSGWRGLQGGFEPLTISTTEAVVVKGKLNFVGGAPTENGYTALRYALTFQDSSDLINVGTDSATWSKKGSHFGYEFTPRTGTGDLANGSGGAGSVWTINNGNWASTWSNGGKPITVVNQAPRNAHMTESTYDFAISVISVDDVTNKIDWYLIAENNKYWFGGTVIDTATSKIFNNVIFGTDLFEGTEFSVSGVSAKLGDPIDVPEAPWQSYYVDQWGLSAEYNTLWPILNDSTTLVGDATMGGEVMDGWRALQGGFGQDVTISTEKAIIVKGKIEFAGGAPTENGYTALRYALTWQDSNSTLVNALTDSATWSHKGNHFGYEFTPRTGTGDLANGSGGAGTVWTVNNGNWASTWSNGGKPIAVVNQAPRNANMTESVYDIAISVRSIDDYTNEVKWYMIEENNKYWFGGTLIDTATTKKFNSIIFGIDLFGGTEFKVLEMKVDKGDPIDVPEAPWQSYYVDQWGLSAEYNTLWPILNDENTLVGDATMGGEVMDGWRALQGGFGQDVTISTEKAIIVKGKIEFAGGAPTENGYTALRYALTWQDSNSTLVNALTDSATWSHKGNHFGYEFTPRTGTADLANGSGGAGTVWTVNNGNWASTWSNGGKPIAVVNQAPRNANMTESVYDIAISVRSIDDYTNEIKWYMIEEDQSYWFGGTLIDTATTKKFNSIIFGIDLFGGTEFKVLEMKVDKGDPIDVPDAPFNMFYVSQWGSVGGKIQDWTVTPGKLVGDASVAGSAPAGDWVTLRGEFDSPSKPSVDENLALEVSGKIELVGGGFEDWSSLRLGIFNSSTAGDLDSNNAWTGDEIADGYLILPMSGEADMPTWGETPGTMGAIVNSSWISTNGENNIVLKDKMPEPVGAVGAAGEYEFYIWVVPVEGKYDIRYQIKSEDGSSYVFEGGAIDENMTTDVFNSFNIGLNSSTATAMNLIEVKVDRVKPEKIPVAVSESGNSLLPSSYELSQNYPNPFNPTTTIEFSLPQNSHVKLVVYDALGRAVSELVNKEMSAGYYKTNFNAANLASGVYFYRIEAGNFVTTKKLMLLK